MTTQSNNIQRVRLTGRASRFLGLLAEFGHFEAEEFTEFSVALSSLGSTRETLLDVEDVRRLAAQWLFGTEGMPSKGAHLAEDWPILFS